MLDFGNQKPQVKKKHMRKIENNVMRMMTMMRIMRMMLSNGGKRSKKTCLRRQ